MAEERIMICSITDYTITETDKGDLFEGKIEPHNANVFSRAEAIEKMSDAIDKLGLDIDAIDAYNCAEVALNALLED